MKVSIYLENGLFFQGESFGAEGTAVGEIVFNTSLTGYQEIITDPSYAGQFIIFTMPEIGNVGVNDDDMESKTAHCKGIFARNYNEKYSNFRGKKALSTLLKENNILGICDIDTRYLTKTLRDNGAMMMIASTEISSKEELKALLGKAPRIEDINYIEQVSTKETYIHKYGAWNHENMKYNKAVMSDKKIVVVDFGVKRNILNELTQVGLECEVYPASTPAEVLIEKYNNEQ